METDRTRMAEPGIPSHSELVERLVAEVVRRLNAPAHGTLGDTAAVRPTDGKAGELVVAEPVVSWQWLEDRLDGVQRVVVADRAVVTPTVRDELARRGIELVKRPVEPGSRLLVIDESSNHVAAGLPRVSDMELKRLACRRMIIDSLCSIVREGKCGVWVTERPASAVCQANAQGVPAYIAWNDRQWQEALHELDIRVLVLDARRPQPDLWRRWMGMLQRAVAART
ncbi:MAG: hypothetical protein KatS3mg110_1146 [Pirellulaceae bacterium]|nr:MAG: hypothetical protein KatS3mg110_1146 [Pirellulaceae bacterium]